jgi:hypothetical protein
MVDSTATIPDPRVEVAVSTVGEPVSEAGSTGIPGSLEHWWRIADFGVLGLWIAVVSFALPYHEKWADEAQAWLIARDLDLRTIWFHELRYEGSPGLWHTILWIAQHVFHAKYGALGYIGMAGAIAGVALLIFKAPFPRYLRWPLAFTYFLVYQYAVIARPYTLFAFFCLIAARQYRDLRRPGLFALSLVPLANLTAHGSVVAAALGLTYAIKFIGQWRETNVKTRRTFVLSAAVLSVMYIFLFFVLLPPPDVEATHQPTMTGIIFLHRSLGAIGGALVDNGWISLVLLCILAGWCYLRRALAPFLVPAVSLVFLYVYTAGWPHYQGTIFLTMLAALTIAWPSDEERKKFDARQFLAYRSVTAVLAIVIAYQIYAAAIVIRNDVNLPYSGAVDTAQFLKAAVAQGKKICGYQYGMVGVAANFDHNIFANWPRSYYHHSITEFDPRLVFDQMRTSDADYIVTNWWDPWDETKFREGLLAPLVSWGYTLAHVSDGYLLTKAGYSHRQIYLVFKREPSRKNQ